MRGIYNSSSVSVKLSDPLKYFVSALRIDCNGRFVKYNKLWFVGNTAGYIQSSEQTARQFFRLEFYKVLKTCKFNCFLYILFSQVFICYVKTAEIINIFVNIQFIENCYVLHYNTDLFFYFII